jgi:heme A synthase
MAAVVVFGALAVTRGLSPILAALDVGSAFLVLALTVTAAASSCHNHLSPAGSVRPSFGEPHARLGLWTLGGVYAVLITGVLVARSGSIVRCVGWPLYGSGAALADMHDWLQMVRSIFAAGVTLLAVAVVVRAVRSRRLSVTARRLAAGMGAFFLVETLIGLFMTARGLNGVLLLVYAPAMVAVFALLAGFTVLSGLEASAPETVSPQRPWL